MQHMGDEPEQEALAHGYDHPRADDDLVVRTARSVLDGIARNNTDQPETRYRRFPYGSHIRFPTPRHVEQSANFDEYALIEAADGTLPPLALLDALMPRPATHVLAVFAHEGTAARATCEQGGYLYVERERLMRLPLTSDRMAFSKAAPSGEASASGVHQICQEDEMRRLNVQRGRDVFRPAHLRDPEVTVAAVTAAADGAVTAASATSGATSSVLSSGRTCLVGRACYVSAVYTPAEARGKGYARLLMRYLLHEAAAQGAGEAVLISTPEGESLYRGLGFEDLGPILWFLPATMSQ